MEENNVKVSVIIPVYNVEKYLRQCMDSVVNQTLRDIEIICVDDGSTDGSGAILDEYAAKDGRIKVIHKENGGLSSARNEGLKYVLGEYIYFLDSDDYIEHTLLEYAITIFNNFDVDYFCFGSKAFCEDECVQSLEGMNHYLTVKRDGVFNLNFDIGLNTNIHVWNKVFKTSLIKKYNIRFIDNLIYEDIYFMWYYFFVSKKAYFDNEIYHHYRIRSNSIMEQVTKNKTFESGMAHMYNWHELILSLGKNKDLFIENYKNLVQLLDSCACRTKEMIPACDKYKVELLKNKYQNELTEIGKSCIGLRFYSYINNVFSIKNASDEKHKVICFCGVKVKIRR